MIKKEKIERLFEKDKIIESKVSNLIKRNNRKMIHIDRDHPFPSQLTFLSVQNIIHFVVMKKEGNRKMVNPERKFNIFQYSFFLSFSRRKSIDLTKKRKEKMFYQVD